MTSTELERRLWEFLEAEQFVGKGPLSVALVVTAKHAREKGLPLDPDELLTVGRGQVTGLGGGTVKKILEKHGIMRPLAAEGGRTSRNSIQNMRNYVAVLNDLYEQDLISDIDPIESFWIGRVRDFFAAHPFRIGIDNSKSLGSVVGTLIELAQERQREVGTGTYYLGAVLQHLVGAKVTKILGKENVQHHGFSTADAPTGRPGDFVVGDVAIHVTTSPSDAMVAKCNENLKQGLRPVIVTLQRKIAAATQLVEIRGSSDRIEIWDAEQFFVANFYEWGQFSPDGRRDAIRDLLDTYNEIVANVESDPSIRIELS